MRTKKITRTALALAMLCPLGSAVDASAYDITVSEGENGAYWGTAPDGVSQLGFEVNQDYVYNAETQNHEYVYRMWLSNFKIYNAEVELPENVTVTSEDPNTELAGKTFPITRLGNRDNFVNWYDSDGISLVIPASYTEIGDLCHWMDKDGYGRDVYPTRITFNGTVPPSLNLGRSSETLYLVPAEAIETYRLKCANEENGWRSDFPVLPVNYREYVTEVNVVAGTLEDQLIAAAGSMDNIYNLKITGEINGRDMNAFAKMKYLHSLDLSALDLKTLRGCNDLRWMEEVKLPASIAILEESAFQNCTSLSTIDLTNVTTINNSAFLGCSSLSKIELPAALTIGYAAFSECNALTSAEIPVATNIGGSAFSGCSALTSVNIPNVETLGHGAFRSCRALSSISIPKVKSIDGDTFSGCENLSKIELNPELGYIGYSAFANTAITEFRIPSGLSVDSDAFRDSAIARLYLSSNRAFNNFISLPMLEDIYSYDPIPSPDGATSTATLHVPGFSLPMFRDNPDYYGVNKIVALEENITELNVYSDLTISTNESLADKFDLKLEMGGRLQNDFTGSLSVGNFTQEYGYMHDRYSGPTLISNGDITADNVTVSLGLRNREWSFISFPFSVDINTITTPNEALWVVREYNGATRANRVDNTVSSWENTTSMMEGGKGYILHFSSNSGDNFTFTAVDDAKKNNLFAKDDVILNLEYNPAPEGFEHNSSWNLVGNPYDAFFALSKMEISDNANIITVWDRGYNTYEAFSFVDDWDAHALSPFEAFFVQAPRDNAAVTFHKEGRFHTYEEAVAKENNEPSRMPSNSLDRAIINLHIAGNGTKDRTRLIINEQASAAYEISCDASKFLSLDEATPQIYMMENDVKMAIDERPMGSGEFSIGTRIGADGEYTLSADTRNADYALILTDLLTGIETDLSENDYRFAAQSGDSGKRFALRLRDSSTNGVSDISNDGLEVNVNGNLLDVTAAGDITVYSIDGTAVAEGNGSLSAVLEAGIYVVKANCDSRKIFVGK